MRIYYIVLVCPKCFSGLSQGKVHLKVNVPNGVEFREMFKKSRPRGTGRTNYKVIIPPDAPRVAVPNIVYDNPIEDSPIPFDPNGEMVEETIVVLAQLGYNRATAKKMIETAFKKNSAITNAEDLLQRVLVKAKNAPIA